MKISLSALKKLIFTILLFVGFYTAEAQFFYGLQQEYGKNRVQFNEFNWFFFRFEGYDVYFYRGNEKLARQVSRMVNENLPQIEQSLDSQLDERLKIMVFNDLSDLKQSNVNSSSEEAYSSGGVTRISGRRLFVHFNGDYSELKTELRSALAEAVLSNMVYGSFTKAITNSTLLNLPRWYTEGLISFIGEKWSADIQTEVQDGFYSEKFDRLSAVNTRTARYLGHSFWYFIAQSYGERVIRNIVYMSVVNRDIESGFLYILGKDLKTITKDWREFYKERFDFDKLRENFPKEPFIDTRKNHRITHIAMSPNGRHLAYVDQRFSRYKLYLYDFKEDNRDRLLTDGYRIAQNADYSFPLLAWHPNNEILAFITEEEGFVYLNFYNREKDELRKKKFFKFDKVLSFEYSQDGKQLLMSATEQGQSDIFVYTILNDQVTRITNDDQDDLYPTFFDNDERIAWSSNRTIDSLYPRQELTDMPDRENDLFATANKELGEDSISIWRMTNSDGVNETRVKEYEPGFLTFLSDRDNQRNQHILKIDSSIAFVDTTTHYRYTFSEYKATNYDWGIVHQVFAPSRDKRYDLILRDERYALFEKPYLSPRDLNLQPISKAADQKKESPLPDKRKATPTQNTTPLYYPGIDPSAFEVNINNYKFTDEQEKDKDPQKADSVRMKDQKEQKPIKILPEPSTQKNTEKQKEEDDDFKIPNRRNYFLSFYQDNFSVGFDNRFNNKQYQRFTGQVSNNLLNSGFNANLKVGVLELMHNYRIIGGMRATFQPLAGTSIVPNAEFLLGFGDYKDRLDKLYTFNRRSQVQYFSNFNFSRLISNQVTAKFTWPFTPVGSIRGSIGYRLDENINLSRDLSSSQQPTDYTSYAIGRLSYVYDNTRKLGLNLYSGLRYKLFTEYYRNLSTSPSGLHTAGIDARHYLKIHRNLIWANRFAAGTSFGPEKLIYIMGGVDNSFGPETDQSTPIAQENNYIFQTLVTNMRGFIQNARNGNNFGVINSEIRWPFISYFSAQPIRNDFFKNLMFVGFTDVGTAWNGPSPYARENAINTRTVSFGSDGEIVLDSQKEPIIVGVGGGLRSRLFGYYIRFDWAWGIEDGIVLPSQIYFSLSKDF